ncbi:MAG TPA: FkbM family methyltransferase [Rhizomicrobium sp.]|jgi:FkbM family methyltransferase|nr:FkbM family methyltransferase [Rhizomicrobium sp.]
MSIGARSSLWRRVLLRTLASVYLRRRGVTPDGLFEVYVSGGSSLKVLDPRYLRLDPVHLAFIHNWVVRDSTVWDIGANLGLFAFPAALKAREGKVFAFEPDADVAGQISRSLRLPCNQDLSIAVQAFAVSDHDGTAEFEVSAYSTAMSRLKGEAPWHDQSVHAREVRRVAVRTIDSLAKEVPSPSIIKIDVEGAEMKVLEGGRGTIARCRPVMLIEGPHTLWDAMGTFLRELDYVMFDGADRSNEPLSHPVWDTVAVPREKYR